MFSTKECAWAQTSVRLLGSTLEGIVGFEFNKEIEKELIYASGDEAIDMTAGNKKVDGSLTLLKYEWDKLNDAAQLAGYNDITEVPHYLILITCAFKLNSVTPIRIIEIPQLGFTKWGVGLEQNSKQSKISMPFLALKAILRKG
jgi:hypothetical protein